MKKYYGIYKTSSTELIFTFMRVRGEERKKGQKAA